MKNERYLVKSGNEAVEYTDFNEAGKQADLIAMREAGIPVYVYSLLYKVIAKPGCPIPHVFNQ